MKTHSLRFQLIRGAFWTAGTRWAIKAVGFLNTIIMARLLMPEDYGLVAMATVAIGVVQSFLDFGARVVLLSKQEVTGEEVNSAWTLSVIQGAMAFFVVVALTPAVAIYFNEHRLEWVLPCLAFGLVLSSFSNIGTVLALKEYNFRLDFRIQIYSKVISVVATIVFGIALRDYRALMFGIVTGCVAQVYFSYRWHPYRPRWDLSRIREIWGVSKWLMLSNIGGFVLERSDQLIAIRLSDARAFGLYHVGSELGQLPVGELGPAMLRALLPVLSEIKDDVERLHGSVTKVLVSINTIIWPIGVFLMAISAEATVLILGSKWLDASPFVAFFALVALLRHAGAPLKSLLLVSGHSRSLSVIVWLDFFVFALAVLVMAPTFGLIGLVYARILGAFVGMVATFMIAKRECGLAIMAPIIGVARPVFGSVVIGLCVYLFGYSYGGSYLVSFLSVSSAVLLYVVWCFVSWWFCGRPDGLEALAFDRFKGLKPEWFKG